MSWTTPAQLWPTALSQTDPSGMCLQPCPTSSLTGQSPPRKSASSRALTWQVLIQAEDVGALALGRSDRALTGGPVPQVSWARLPISPAGPYTMPRSARRVAAVPSWLFPQPGSQPVQNALGHGVCHPRAGYSE
jgi:hypothetical protein